MVRFLQLPVGPGFRRRRMVNGVVFWFLITGVIRGSLSSIADKSKAMSEKSPKEMFQAATLYKKNAVSSNRDVNTASVLHRPSRELPQTKNENELLFDKFAEADGISETIKILPVKSKSLYVIPYFRPGRSNSKNDEKSNAHTQNSITPMDLFDHNNSNFIDSGSESEKEISVSKRHETIIPTMRFGRTNGKTQNNNFDSVIPYPRLGRSFAKENKNDAVNDDEIPDEDYIKTPDEKFRTTSGNEMHDDSSGSAVRQKRDSDDYDTIIPYPRIGRQEESEDASLLGMRKKRTDSDYVLPQMRYGRSVVLLSSPKTGESPKGNPNTFVLPYPRPGRSSKYPEKTENSKNLLVILPYPRPGRSKSDLNAESLEWDKRQNEFMLPFARLGRSAMKIPFTGKEFMTNGDIFKERGVNSLPPESEQKIYLEKSKDTVDLSSLFMIPYPRPGKKSLNLAGSQGKLRQNKGGKVFSDYVLPYPRPGKKSSIPSKVSKNSNKENENVQKFILPYPRPGRSSNNWFDENLETLQQTRLGSSVESALPYFILDHYKDENTEDSDYSLPDYEVSVTEESFTDRNNDDTSHMRYKRSNSIVPYPRPGRSELVIPYPRLGRSDSIVPYPRLGRSNFVLPYPRIGKSNSVVPYPRPGRSNSAIPYPRVGRSNSVIPYPRVGKSNSVIPYPRIGRSDSIVPYPRPGRSNSIVPYPRLGRSEYVVPYPRPGRSDSTVPYIRQDRSSLIIPYPRPGRSNSVVPYPRPGRSRTFQVFPRLRSSLSTIPYLRLRRSRQGLPLPVPKYEGKTGNWILPNIRPGRSDAYEYEYDVIPYPQLGGSQNNLMLTTHADYSSIAKRRIEDMIIPNLRPGQSAKYDQGYVLPHPRLGRSNSNTRNMDEVTNSNTVIPYPRLGRSQEFATTSPESISPYHRLNKHMLSRVDDSIYILPYPRPGRDSD